MNKNKKKLVIIPLGVLGLAGVTAAIAVPIILSQNSKSVVHEWDKKLPAIFYATDKDDAYTTDVTKAKGYQKEVMPNLATPPKPSSTSSQITIDGVKYTANNLMKFDKAIPDGTFYEMAIKNSFTTDYKLGKGYIARVVGVSPSVKGVEINSLPGGTAYDSAKWSWVETNQGTPGVDAVAEVRPSVKGVEINNLPGGTAYDSSKWSWVETNQGTPGVDAVAEVRPSVKGIEISNLPGGTAYDSTKWSWTEKIAPVVAVNSKFFGIDLGSPNIIKPTNGSTKKALLKILWDSGHLTLDGTLMLLNGFPTQSSPGASGTTFEAYFSNAELAYDILVGKIISDAKKDSTKIIKAPYPQTEGQLYEALAKYGEFSNGQASSDGEFVPSYSNVEINSLKVNSPTQPTSAPAGFIETSDYNIGVAKVDKSNGTPDEYTPSYDNVQIASLKTNVAYDGSSKGTAPTSVPAGFSDTVDYSGGAAKVDKSNGTPDEYTSSYNGVQIASLKTNVAYDGSSKGAAPTNVPAGFSETSDYNIGVAKVDKSNGTPDEYTPSYDNVQIASLKTNVAYDGSSKGTAPTSVPAGFVDANDYNAGTNDVPETKPVAVAKPSAIGRAKDDIVKVDNISYVVQENLSYDIRGKTLDQLSLYRKGTNYVTDPKESTDYLPAVVPKSVTITNPPVGKQITIDGILYTYK